MAGNILIRLGFLLCGVFVLIDAQDNCDIVGGKEVFRCDCQILYDCDSNSPTSSKAELFRDLAPAVGRLYDITLAGKRNRRNKPNAGATCKRFCAARVAAFLQFYGVDEAYAAKGETRFNVDGANILCNYAVKQGKITDSITPYLSPGTDRTCGFWYRSKFNGCGISGPGEETSMGNTGCWFVDDGAGNNFGIANPLPGDDNVTPAYYNSLGMEVVAGAMITFTAPSVSKDAHRGCN